MNELYLRDWHHHRMAKISLNRLFIHVYTISYLLFIHVKIPCLLTMVFPSTAAA